MITFLFFSISLLLLISALSIILAKNPIHSVLFLILVFISSSGLLLLLEVEFLGMIFLIIYIGAISVLFLFIIMMLNIRMIELKENLIKYVPITLLIAFVLICELLYYFYSLNLSSDVIFNNNDIFDFGSVVIENQTNLQLLGYLVYTYYVDFFLICGMLLFVGMIGAIMLTLNLEINSRKQDLFDQINRDFKKTIISTNFINKK